MRKKLRIALIVCVVVGMNAANLAGTAGCGGDIFSWWYLTVESTAPADASNAVPRDTMIVVEFSDTLDPTTVTIASFYLFGTSEAVEATVTTDGVYAILTPTEPLEPMTVYKGVLTSDIASVNGDNLWGGYQWRFITGNNLNAEDGR